MTTLMHITTPAVELTDAEHSVLEAAWLRLLEFQPGQTFARMELGERIDCTEAANAMAARGYITKPDACITEAGLNAIGEKSHDQIMNLRMRGKHNGLIVAHRAWTVEQGDVAEAAVGPDCTFEEYDQALGTPAEVLLTGDGHGYNNRGWCGCGNNFPAAQITRFERWTSLGRVAHGWLHTVCRKLYQSG